MTLYEKCGWIINGLNDYDYATYRRKTKMV